MNERLPDFLVIGALKAGTTTLYRWLDQQPDVHMSSKKETRYFDLNWDRGIEWYLEFFDGATASQRVGEASPQYTSPQSSEVAAARIAELLPDVRLVYVVRHPIERLLSEYRYAVHRRAVTGPLLEDRSSDPVGISCYHACLSPYIARFAREQICVVRFEDMIRDDGLGWSQILAHLGIPDRVSPRVAYNVSANLAEPTPMTRRLSYLRRRLHLPRPPAALRDAIARKRPTQRRDPLDGQDLSVLDEVATEIWDDVDKLEAWLGVTEPLWSREPWWAAS